MTYILTVILIVAVGVAIWWPFRQEERRKKIGREARKGAPGGYARLSQGVTYFRWFGPVRGPVVVAVHGLMTPSIIFEPLANELGTMGYRVLTYDLYGRGLSDAPAGAQDRAFFLQQLNDLLVDQEVTEEFTLVGHSMGGAIATAFTESSPHRISRLILIATSGIQTNESAFSRYCRTIPYVGDWLHHTFAPRRIATAIESDAAASELPALRAAQLAQLDRRGFLAAVLGSRRGMLSETQKSAHQTISREDIPVIAVWGDEDSVIPISALGVLAQWNRVARHETIAGAGHGLLYSHPAETNAAVHSMLVERD